VIISIIIEDNYRTWYIHNRSSYFNFKSFELKGNLVP
jgi:hypothetical protein